MIGLRELGSILSRFSPYFELLFSSFGFFIKLVRENRNGRGFQLDSLPSLSVR